MRLPFESTRIFDPKASITSMVSVLFNSHGRAVNAYGLDFQDGGDGYLYSVGTNYSSSNFTQHFYISRYNKANYNLPTSGQISIDQFYGAGSN